MLAAPARVGSGKLTPGRKFVMAKQKNLALCVESDGKRRYIRVPEGSAKELHNYLRGNRVRSSPPEPAYTGFDFIELPANVDVAGVQALLNEF
jgi:hypothetical protein